MSKGQTNPSILPTSSPDGLGNPALVAVASVIPWGFIVKTIVLGGIAYYAIRSFKKSFSKLNEVTSYGAANISFGQAKSKADVLHTAMRGFGNGFATVKNTIAGINYNGWVRLYNAFGNRPDNIPGTDDMNLVEWFQSEFSEDELDELRVLINNVF